MTAAGERRRSPADLFRSHWGLALATVACGTAYVAMLVLDATEGTLRAAVTPRTLWWYALAFVGFLGAVWWAERRGIDRRWMWGAAIAFRVLLLFTTPTLSDDVYRYLWDGHLTTQGQNPYEFVVDDPQLDRYEIPARAEVNNPSYSTPYLPGVQVVAFAPAALLLPSSPWVMQVLMVGFDLAAAGLIVRLLALARLPERRVLLWLWNPLVIVELAHGAHFDALMIALTLAALASTLRSGPRSFGTTAPVALGVATLTRLLPALIVPALWWRWSWTQRLIYPVVMLVLIVPFAIGPGLGLFGDPVRTGVFGSIRVFTTETAFNGGVFVWVERWLADVGIDDPGAAARTVVAVALAAVLVAVAFRARHASDVRTVLRLAAVPLMASIVLANIVHPWYLLIVVALLPFVTPGDDEAVDRWWHVAPWLYLSAGLPLSYLTYRDPDRFGELEWVRRVEWLPALALLTVSLFVAARPMRDAAQRRVSGAGSTRPPLRQ